MFQVLDTATLLRLLDAAPEAVFHTIETGGWSGCVWPGHPEWELHEACAQIRALALHYVTVRHPAADRQHGETIAQILASQACPQGGAAHLEAEPRVHQAMLWLWAVAGGPSASELSNRVRPAPIPGGDPAAFTTASLALLETLIFTGEGGAQEVAMTFLQRHHGARAQRAVELVDALSREETARTVDAEVTCTACGAEGLELWYSGQTWGETLCEPCYEARVSQGQARPQDR